MKVFIIEDEQPAVTRLSKMLLTIRPDIEITGQADSIQQAVAHLNQYLGDQLIFMDIHLADGNSFEIFNRVVIDIPVIFTTAYDQYAIQAFKQNSIDYLLKPISLTDLSSAIQKFKKNHEF